MIREKGTFEQIGITEVFQKNMKIMKNSTFEEFRETLENLENHEIRRKRTFEKFGGLKVLQ